MAHDLGDAAVKQALLASANRKVLALDGAKFGRGAWRGPGLVELRRGGHRPHRTRVGVAGLRANGVEVHRA